MKLATDIALRKDKTVTVNVPGSDGKRFTTYTFKADAGGQVVADIENEEHVGYLLDTGNFYPADEKDIGRAVDVVKDAQTQSAGNTPPAAVKPPRAAAKPKKAAAK